jgi:23S rRNA pseudouridine2605 synthase
MSDIRLQKYMADAGYASRRKSEELINQGRVTVNGVTADKPGIKVNKNDIVEVDGVRLELSENLVYIMLNKPAGCITSAKDQFGRKTVLDYVKDIKERVFPVGRLDYDTSGLLLLTNDGELTYSITHPSHEVEKVYLAEVEGIPGKNELNAFRSGLVIDGYKTAPAGIESISSQNYKTLLQITIHEGRNRQVRKMCEAIGHRVIKLNRIRIGEIELGDLPEGRWRKLTEEEIEKLR